MLYFAPHRGFAVFDIPFPVGGFVTDFGKTSGTAVNTKVNLRKMLIVGNFRTFLYSKIAGIPVDYLVIFPEQICCCVISCSFAAVTGIV